MGSYRTHGYDCGESNKLPNFMKMVLIVYKHGEFLLLTKMGIFLNAEI
jgi:hypothetical protein